MTGKIFEVHEPAVRMGGVAYAARPATFICSVIVVLTFSTGGSAIAQDATALQEVIVTAQKKLESVQDIPIPISAIDGQFLVQNNELRLFDYFTEVPGLTVTPQTFTPPGQIIAIRGIVGFAGSTTTGVMLDDLPVVTASANNSTAIPDLDPGDVTRVEVLRGPQGTLYGANSMGGLIKYDTIDPSTDSISGHVTAGTQAIYNGAHLGYNFRGSINIPVDGALAVRASAFLHDDPGYIDNPILGIRGINESHSEGARLAALWKPSDNLSLRLTATVQKTYSPGFDFSNLTANTFAFPGSPDPVGHFTQNQMQQAPFERKEQIYGAVLRYKIGSVELTSVTGWLASTYSSSSDVSFLNFFTMPPNGPYTVPGVALLTDGKVGKFIQEFRASIQMGPQSDLLLGGFFTHEDSDYNQNYVPADPYTGEIPGPFGYVPQTTTYREYAGFANLTYHPNARFNIQFGVRDSQIKQTLAYADYGSLFTEEFLGQPSPYFGIPQNADNHAVTFLVAPSYKLTPDVMTYARIASGYRPGGPNGIYPGLPPTYDPDKTFNYELGLKGAFLNRRLSVDASLFYIDWRNIQLTLTDEAISATYTANAGGAKSEGVELSIETHPVDGLTVSGWVDWTRAELTKNFPAQPSGLAGVPGDPLPFNPKFSGHLSVREEFPLTARTHAFVGVDTSYFSDRKDTFNGAGDDGLPAPRQDLPAYAETNVRAGLKHEDWTLNVFANNVANRECVIQGGTKSGQVLFLRPRLVGLNLTRSF